MSIAIVKYNAGNTRSVANALLRLGHEPDITDDPARLAAADKVIFPGVGNAGSAMHHLRNSGLDQVLLGLTQPVLGICLGMQLLGRHSEENDTPTLGLISQPVVKFEAGPQLKVPHMGWNQVQIYGADPLFANLPAAPWFYFVHSYYMQQAPETIATCNYGITFSAAVRYKHIVGVQFHPEKSGLAGQIVLQNFINL